MAKQIVIPQPIVLVSPGTKNPLTGPTGEAYPPFTFRDFVIGCLLVSPNFDSPAGWRAAAKIEAGLEKAVATDRPVILDEAQYAILAEVAKNPSYVVTSQDGTKSTTTGLLGVGSSVARQLIPFLDAIIEAEDV